MKISNQKNDIPEDFEPCDDLIGPTPLNERPHDVLIDRAIRGAGDAITVDVKGLAGKTSWPVDNVGAGTCRPTARTRI